MPNKTNWYKLAQKQTFETLPAFIKKVQKAFPGYELLKAETEYKTPEDSLAASLPLYKNGIKAGIIISYAAFNATSNTYHYSCNQAGVVRNCFYKAIMDTPEPLENI